MKHVPEFSAHIDLTLDGGVAGSEDFVTELEGHCLRVLQPRQRPIFDESVLHTATNNVSAWEFDI